MGDQKIFNKIYGLDSRIEFGMHKGMCINMLINNEPDYITWCIDSVEGFELDNEAYETYEYAISDTRD